MTPHKTPRRRGRKVGGRGRGKRRPSLPLLKKKRLTDAGREMMIGPAKFAPGTRVTHDFGSVTGIPRAKCRVAGTITKVYAKFAATDMGYRAYVVALDELFCGERS